MDRVPEKLPVALQCLRETVDTVIVSALVAAIRRETYRAAKDFLGALERGAFKGATAARCGAPTNFALRGTPRGRLSETSGPVGRRWSARSPTCSRERWPLGLHIAGFSPGGFRGA